MVSDALKDVKVVLKLAKGSQTISGCNKSASNEQLYELATAVASLEAESLEIVTKVEERTLISE